MTLDKYTQEQLSELSLIDMTYLILENSPNKQTISFLQIMDEIKKATGLTDEQVRAKIAQFYTDLNIDGRFLCMGDNRWGLRSWYPVEQAEEDTITQLKPKKKKAKKKDDDELDLEDYDDLDEEDLDYDDLDDFEEDDLLDDEDESFDELDDADDDDFEEEELLEDEEVFDEDLGDDEDLDDEEEEDFDAVDDEDDL